MTRSTSPLREIEAILSRGIGLNIGSIGSSMVPIAIQARRRKRNVASDTEYAKLLASSPTEFQALVEEIVVPETWFFRHRESFALLAEWARKWLPSHPYHALRILSAPCASGEEPYTVVMALFDSEISPERFSIEAMDISAIGLEKARKAVYGRNSFRGQPLNFRDKYFKKTPEGWRLDEAVARQVHFRQANLIDPELGLKEASIDVIFCRNLLIYFDRESRTRVMNTIRRVLAPDGVLFLGHAEGGLAREFGFEPIHAPMAFAFRKAQKRVANKAAPKPPAPAFPKIPPRLPASEPFLAKMPAPAAPMLPLPPRQQPAPRAPKSQADTLTRAQELADEGHIDKARAACKAVLDADAQCAGAYYLLALVEEAAGCESRAEEYYRKTLYIQPDHEEALVQLSLLEQKQGLTAVARQLRERASRVRARKESQQHR